MFYNKDVAINKVLSALLNKIHLIKKKNCILQSTCNKQGYTVSEIPIYPVQERPESS